MAVALTEKGKQRNHRPTHRQTAFPRVTFHSTAMEIRNTPEGGVRQLGTSSAAHPPAFQVTVKVCSASTLLATQSSRGVNITLLQGFTSPVEEQCSSGAVLLLIGAALHLWSLLQEPYLHSYCFSHSLLRITALQPAWCHQCYLLRFNSIVVISLTHTCAQGRQASSLSPAEGTSNSSPNSWFSS